MKKTILSLIVLVSIVALAITACSSDPVATTIYDSIATFTGEWTVDRSEPKAFVIDAGKISVAVDTQKDSSGFYRYQGKKSFLDMTGVVEKWEVATNLVLTQEDINNENYMSSIWLDVSTTTATQGLVDWTIIEFVGGENNHFNWWDSAGTGEWNEISNVSPVVGNNEIRMTFDNGTFTLHINGVQVSQYSKTENNTVFTESLIRSIIIQVSNEKSGASGNEFTANWTVPRIEYLAKN